jgi:hypothetical protein
LNPTLDDHFGQLMRLRGIFGDPRPGATTLHKAWRRAASGPEVCLAEKFISSTKRAGGLGRLPTGHAVFMECMVVTAIMYRKRCAAESQNATLSAEYTVSTVPMCTP